MPIKLTTLKNGIRVLTDERKDAKMVSVDMYVQTGSKDEPIHQKGIAHFIEHMMFRGTKEMDAEKLRKAFADLGIYTNGFTGPVRTDYTMNLLKEDLPQGMKLFSDMLCYPAFEEKGFEIEKGVVINEIRQAPDNTERSFYMFFNQSVYPNSPLALDTLGTEKIIQGLKAQDLRKYWRDHYTTDKISLIAKGGISHQQFVKICRALFTSFKQAKNTIKPYQYTADAGLKKKVVEKQSQIFQAVAFPYRGKAEKDFFARQLIMQILSRGSSSRLWNKVREERGMAYSVSAFINDYSSFGNVAVYIQNKPDNVEEVLQLVCEECRRIHLDMTENELIRAKRKIWRGFASDVDRLSSSAADMLRIAMLFGRIVQAEELQKGFESVTLKDVKRVAKRMFSVDPTVVIMGPKCKTPSYKTICKWLKGES